MFGNIVGIAFRNLIRFYWQNYIPLPKVDAHLWSWTLTVRWVSISEENGAENKTR